MHEKKKGKKKERNLFTLKISKNGQDDGMNTMKKRLL